MSQKQTNKSCKTKYKNFQIIKLSNKSKLSIWSIDLVSLFNIIINFSVQNIKQLIEIFDLSFISTIKCTCMHGKFCSIDKTRKKFLTSIKNPNYKTFHKIENFWKKNKKPISNIS